MKPFYKPGIKTERFPGWHYNLNQATKQSILSDMAYGAAYGFSQTRLPKPGVTLSAEFVAERMTHVAEGWAYETGLRSSKFVTSTFDPRTELPPLAHAHYAARLRDYPQMDRPWDKSTTGGITLTPPSPESVTTTTDDDYYEYY